MTYASTPLEFGPFTFDRAARALFRSGQPVRVGGRALDLLGAMIERAGEVLSREELEAKVWPKIVVEETSLRVHISSLRRALREREDNTRYIANVPGRGYAFIGTVTSNARPPGSHQRVQAVSQALNNLPRLLTRPVGRGVTIDSLRKALRERRLVSITGAGGMGKTTVAIATAESSLELFPDGVKFVDLSPVSDPSRVAPTVADTFGLALPVDGGAQLLVGSLRDRRTLIVLDNCEQVIEGAADLVHAIITGTRHVRILATSRESLDVPGEWIHRLAPLGLPRPNARNDQSAPSVQLFVQRATAIDESFTLTPTTTPLVHRLCRQLDGMPLAIELAAGRIDTLGLQGLVDRLSDMFHVLTRGRRTAAPRHQTLQALLDWSHDLLTETDRKVLRRVAVFRGAFTLDAATHVGSCESIDATAATDSLIGLVSKSLVAVDHSLGSTRFRLLATTRAYALARLTASGEWNAVSHRHASGVQSSLEAANREMQELDRDELRQRRTGYTALMDDLRGALDWALSAQGDHRLGVTLMLAAEKVIEQLCVMDEFRPRLELALRRAQSLVPPDLLLEFRALSALCRSAGVSPDYGIRNPAIFSRLRELVDQTGDRDDRIAALQSMLTQLLGNGDYAGVADLAHQVIRTAGGPHEPAAIFLGERLLAQGHHAMGRHAESLEIVDRILAYPTRRAYARYVGNIPVAVSLGVLKARIAWMRGSVDDAWAIVSEKVDIARGLVPFVLGYALGLGAIPILMWRGEAEAAARLTSELRDLAHESRLDYWTSWARMCEVALAVRTGHQSEDVARSHKLTARESDMIGTWDERLVTPRALHRAETGQVGWSAAETLRCATWQRLREGSIGLDAADLAFQHATDIARAQEASSWELRIATSRARLWSLQGRRGDALALVEGTLERFTQGSETRDHALARKVAEELALDHLPLS